MAADKLFRKPSLDVVQGDTLGPMYGVIGANATAAYMIPGKRVMFDTNDNEVKEGGTDPSDNIGVLGYEASPLAFKPADRDTAYARGDHVAVHNTPGMRFRGWLKAGSGAVNPGDTLMGTDASGNFQIAAGDPQVGIMKARALESITPNGSTNTACWMQYIG